MSNTQVELGRFFTDTEDEKHMDVVFIGCDIKDRFFPSTDPIGKTIGIDGRPFEVVGVGEAQGQRVRPVAGQLRRDSRSRPISRSTAPGRHQLQFLGPRPRPSGGGRG